MPSTSSVNRDKRQLLASKKIFVLDNSLRESTVGQVVGHSLADKSAILSATHRCGFRHQIVAAFSHQRRVDDAFCQSLTPSSTPNAESFYYAFSEDSDLPPVNGVMQCGPDCIPVGLRKMKQYGIPNVIIEVDVADDSLSWDGAFSVSQLVDALAFLLTWARENLVRPPSHPQTHFVNLRDFPIAMLRCPQRQMDLVAALARLPHDIRPAGLLFEEPTGEYFADEVAAWSAQVRDVMDTNGWCSTFQEKDQMDGLLLVHVHKQWGMADAVVLEALANGCDGIWCSVAEEGAAMGHACSAVTLANLARLGNKDVVQRYKTRHLATAAREVTRITTNKPVMERQVVYGPRAVEAVFGFGGIGGGGFVDADGDGDLEAVDHFSVAEFLGIDDVPVRISTLASPGLVVIRLQQCFGEDDKFTEKIADRLLQQMKKDLEHNVEAEHTSALGLAVLWQEVTGSCTPAMQNVINKHAPQRKAHEELLEAAKECFGDFVKDGECFEDGLHYQSFYSAYLQPFMGCFACPRTRFVLDSIDLDNNGRLLWKEWRFWCLWALREFGEQICTVDDLHTVVLRQAILPLSVSARAQVRTV